MPFELPYFPMYPADFLSDLNVTLMTNEEKGAYITLLCYQWREGKIPTTKEDIQILLRVDGPTYAKLMLRICKLFPGGVNPRLERERVLAISKHEARSRASLKRWNKNRLTRHPKDGNRISISESYTDKERKKERRPILPPSLLLNSIAFTDAWAVWEKHRKEKKSTLTPETIKKQLRFLEQQPDPIACINQSVEKGWIGLFAFKGELKPNPDLHTCQKYNHNQPFPCGKPANKKIDFDWLCDVHYEQKQIAKKKEKENRECAL